MARGRNNRRRRRGSFPFLLRLLSFAVIVGAIVAAVTLFFRTEHIVVTGNRRYTAEEIIAATDIEPGDNLYLMNKYAEAQKIFQSLPYVEEASINRKLPDTLRIEVRECTAAAAVEGEGGAWLISEKGKLLEQTERIPADCVRIAGAELVGPQPSRQADFGEAGAFRFGVLLTLLRTAEEKHMLAGLGTVQFADETALTFSYLDRFTVQMPWTADVAYKLESLATVVDYLEANETGLIDLMTDGKASFIPD